uniref:RING-type domain-containing protein n=1 Tax=Cuerna arida TaxID=1464854 RepID=A0A1B6FIR6_9HEMI
METWVQVIPTIPITQNHVNIKLQCTVCCENFKVRESACLLECAHMFHPSCIHPWLRLKTTCPVCRHDLQVQEDSQLSNEEDNSDPGISISNSFSDDEMQGQEDNQLSSEDSSQSEISTSDCSSDGELQQDDFQFSTEEDNSDLELSTLESSTNELQILIEENNSDFETSTSNSSSDEGCWI